MINAPFTANETPIKNQMEIIAAPL
jgi:hypothetical protein